MPAYLLAGHINLHNSSACAAQLVTYINYALGHLRADHTGVIKSQYIPSKRKGPRTVTQWREQRAANNQEDSNDEEDELGNQFQPDRPNEFETWNTFRSKLNKFINCNYILSLDILIF